MLNGRVLRLRCSCCKRNIVVDHDAYQQHDLYLCPDCEADQAPKRLRALSNDELFDMRRKFSGELNDQLPGTIAYHRAFASWAQADALLLARGTTE